MEDNQTGPQAPEAPQNSQPQAAPPPPPVFPPAGAVPAGAVPAGAVPAGAVPAPPRKKKTMWRWAAGCLIALFIFNVMIAGLLTSARRLSRGVPFGSRVAIVYLEGPIMSGSDGSIFGGGQASSERVISDLSQASEAREVKAIVLRVNSPGGSAAASQEIYQAVRRARQTGKPVVVSMGDMAASGGYYVSSAADQIFADSGTLTGSIGVIIQTTDMSELFRKIGLRPVTVKSGKHKDMFSPNRALTDEEKALAGAMIRDIYLQFVDDVLAGRRDKGLTREKLLPLADGRVFTGRQALKAHLVDQIGSLQDAVDYAARRAGIRGKPSIWRVKRSFWESLAEARINISPRLEVQPAPGETGLLGQ